MSFNRGDLITATELNNTNSEVQHDEGPTGTMDTNMKTITRYFNCTQDSGVSLGNLHSWGGWNMFDGRHASCELARLENGSWVVKASSLVNNYAWQNADTSLDINSYGLGTYRASCSARYCHGIVMDITNAKTNCQRGDLLVAVDGGMNLSESTVTFSRASGTLLTASLLNDRCVYTQ